MTKEILNILGIMLVLIVGISISSSIEISLQGCQIKGDFDCDGVVSDFELLNYIDMWLANTSITNQYLLEAIDNWWYGLSSEGTQVNVSRDIPATIPLDKPFNISLIIDINESNAPNGIIIEEYIPAGWSVTYRDPLFLNFNEEKGVIRFLAYRNWSIRDMTVNYTVTVLGNATGNITFSGVVEIRNKTVNISGDTSIIVRMYTATSNRTLPEKASTGSRVNIIIALDVNETNKPSGVIVKDYFPTGWNIISSAPAANGINLTNGEIKWILTGEQVFDRVISYVVEIPSSEIGNRTFSGEVIYNDPSDNPITVITEGNSVISVEKQCLVKGDFNCDDKVSDFEVLDYVSRWVKAEVTDFDLLEAIGNWARG